MTIPACWQQLLSVARPGGLVYFSPSFPTCAATGLMVLDCLPWFLLIMPDSKTLAASDCLTIGLCLLIAFIYDKVFAVIAVTADVAISLRLKALYPSGNFNAQFRYFRHLPFLLRWQATPAIFDSFTFFFQGSRSASFVL
jgi:hypothetical protein